VDRQLSHFVTDRLHDGRIKWVACGGEGGACILGRVVWERVALVAYHGANHIKGVILSSVNILI